MKRPIISLLLLLLITTSCLKNFKFCPDGLQFHFFSEDELHFLWEDIDSALLVQEKLALGVVDHNSLDGIYASLDTIYFITQDMDSVQCVAYELLRCGRNTICKDNLPRLARAGLISNSTNYFNGLTIQLDKSTRDEFNKQIDFDILNYSGYSNSFEIGDTIEYEYNIFNDGPDRPGKTYQFAYEEDYQILNTIFPNSLIFSFKDENYTEQFKAVYSRRYGFIEIIKYEDYKITRLF